MRRLLLVLLCAPLLAVAQAPETLFNLVALNAQAEREVPNDPLAYKSVKTQSAGYQTTPVYDKNRVARWRVRQELRLESPDFAAATELVGKLQANLVVAGLTQSVSGESRRKAENALIAEALAAFDERARVVRDAMKAKGYRVRDLQLSSGGAPPRPMLAMASRALSAESVAQPAIEPGSTRILVTVSGTIQLQ